ncbi:winged helix-turn-helix transcriptional regulator [Agromyces mariniharenae]|uniref:Transcriptional regulator n=1 Tax=Agromyces mariniharenae TaxID=2604423 RepID=A0A5S4V249_9MICO|nr:helix-turn-helix domain-containing protein [Agromyces mariniharenae]TYL53052.1 transcriptional regulator [Agromyces mariniharenae]
MATRATRGFGQYSGVARAVERVGERWALLIVRDLLVGARRYGDLKAGLPRIPTNILADRLKELQEAGVVRRVPTVRGGYELTELGRALEPVVVALERWGWSTLGEPAEGELVTADALAIALGAAFRPDAAATLPPTEYVLHVGDVSLSAIVTGRHLDVAPVGPGALPQPRRPIPDVAPEDVLELAVEPTGFRDLVSGVRGTVTVKGPPSGVAILDGGSALLERFRLTFRIDPVAPPTGAASEAGDAASVA